MGLSYELGVPNLKHSFVSESSVLLTSTITTYESKESHNFPMSSFDQYSSPTELQLNQWVSISGVMVTPEERKKYCELRILAPQDGVTLLSDPRLIASILPDDRRETFEARFPHIFSPF